MNYGYLRGSTGEIDKNNQRKAIEKYGKTHELKIIYTEDTVSSGKPYGTREISGLVEQLKQNDTLIVAELSRLARNVEETLKIGRLVIEKGASLYILNPIISITADNDIASKIILNTMAMASEIERYYIRSRTKISLQQRKEAIKKQGFFISKAGIKVYHLGTAKGDKKTLKLEKHKALIYAYLGKGVNKTAIAKILTVSRHTVTAFLKRHPYNEQKDMFDNDIINTR